ncbi:MAG: hypothetical protein AB1733_19505 [Thermodesulfobacteriota bacterium]
MTWKALRWVWRLEAPLFIGMPPAGALNRCRPYVPARVLWGAVTAEISRSRHSETFPDYGKLGWEIALNCRFTYLYPAEKNGDKYLAWMPNYLKATLDERKGNGEQKIGLRWHRLDGKGDLSDRDFRRRLLDSRPGTAIAPETDSAFEGTLRDTECINPWWRDSSDCQGQPIPMLLFGYVFLRNNGFRRQLENVDTLFVGGDTRYGFGKIHRVQWNELSGDVPVFRKPVRLDQENPEICSDTVWGHASEDSDAPIEGMQGMKERLGGWEQGSPWPGVLTWAPGSSLEQSVWWSLDKYGCWMRRDKR